MPNTFIRSRYDQRLQEIRRLIQQGNTAVAQQKIKNLIDWINSFRTTDATNQALGTALQMELKQLSPERRSHANRSKNCVFVTLNTLTAR